MGRLLAVFQMRYYMHFPELQLTIEVFLKQNKNKILFGIKYWSYKRKEVYCVVEQKETL